MPAKGYPSSQRLCNPALCSWNSILSHLVWKVPGSVPLVPLGSGLTHTLVGHCSACSLCNGWLWSVISRNRAWDGAFCSPRTRRMAVRKRRWRIGRKPNKAGICLIPWGTREHAAPREGPKRQRKPVLKTPGPVTCQGLQKEASHLWSDMSWHP